MRSRGIWTDNRQAACLLGNLRRSVDVFFSHEANPSLYSWAIVELLVTTVITRRYERTQHGRCRLVFTKTLN